MCPDAVLNWLKALTVTFDDPSWRQIARSSVQHVLRYLTLKL